MGSNQLTMGKPIPPPIVPVPVPPGTLCTTCWGSGKPFGDGDTPESVTASISGINKSIFWDPSSGEPPNGVVILEQTGVGSCSFSKITASHTFLLTWSSILSRFTIRLPASELVFFDTILNICKTSFENVGTFAFTGGTVEIIIPEAE